MSDPLSLLLAEDEGDTSTLFSSSSAPDPTPPPATTTSGDQEPDGLRGLDASKIKIGKPKKAKKEKGKAKSKVNEEEGPEPAKLYHASGLGLGVTTTTTNTSHVSADAGSGPDLFSLSAPLYSAGNIPGDMFKPPPAPPAGSSFGSSVDASDLLSKLKVEESSSKRRVSNPSLDARKDETDLSDLKIASALVTREDDEDISMFGKSDVRRLDGAGAGTRLDGDGSAKVDDVVADEGGSIDELEARVKQPPAGGGAIEDTLKNLLNVTKGDVDVEDGTGLEPEPEGGVFDFNSYINAEKAGGGGGGLFT